MVGMIELLIPEKLIYSPIATKTRSGIAEGERHSRQSLEADLEKRLAELTEAAIISRSLARQYFRTARRFIAAARHASERPGRSYYEAHLVEARKAHCQARKCLRFARPANNAFSASPASPGIGPRASKKILSPTAQSSLREELNPQVPYLSHLTTPFVNRSHNGSLGVDAADDVACRE